MQHILHSSDNSCELLERYAPVGTYLAIKGKLNTALPPTIEEYHTTDHKYRTYNCDNYTKNGLNNEQTEQPEYNQTNEDDQNWYPLPLYNSESPSDRRIHNVLL